MNKRFIYCIKSQSEAFVNTRVWTYYELASKFEKVPFIFVDNACVNNKYSTDDCNYTLLWYGEIDVENKSLKVDWDFYAPQKIGFKPGCTGMCYINYGEKRHNNLMNFMVIEDRCGEISYILDNGFSVSPKHFTYDKNTTGKHIIVLVRDEFSREIYRDKDMLGE